ncbi:uncharacterized protein K02A2.6-like [Stegodyphus dumicola]|uniref:uncharacterized protein K02A2.6-like n=1 Tax=Stegodyphus dumicola TaxID=202533 RepID=UPI0015AE11AD|nr:uncharacterized protein K02A2.6-like [Stegodyphus dumicola]
MIKLRPRAHHLKTRHLENKILLPNSLVKPCLEIAHAPHFGINKTYEFIKKKYFWKGMFLDTKHICENCQQCLENKRISSRTVTSNIKKSDLAPGEMLAIDIVGKLPRSHDGKFFILTIIDHYSRYLEAIPLTNITSATIIRCMNLYFSKFGIPKIILSDNGSNFCSAEFENFLTDLNIEHRKSSIYYPQSNGIIERVHRTMKESIASLSNQVFEWSDRLAFLKLYYNNSKPIVTGFTPAQLFFGRELNTPLDIK